MNGALIAETPNLENTPIDLLNRQGFVEQIMDVAEALSVNKKNVCYAVNGGWGTGKSFVMDMFEKKAKDYGQEGTNLPRFLVFHYNCWQYDYYEEPLLAIVATLWNLIDKETSIFPEAKRIEISKIFQIIGKGIERKIIDTVEKNTGVPVKALFDLIGETYDETKVKSETDFDPYKLFKVSLRGLQKVIEELAEYQTILFVVDELDRCLPEYTIMVLERLHHLFEGIPNVQVILSIDKNQLEHTVQQIYGSRTNVDKYLAKFISFELDLVPALFEDQEKLNEKFKEYFLNFGYVCRDTNQSDVAEFCQIIFEDLDIRTRIAIIDKCHLLHNILNKDEKEQDFSIMCIEITLCVLKELEIEKCLHKNIGSDSILFTKMIDGEKLFYLRKLTEKYERDDFKVMQPNQRTVSYIYKRGIWGCVLAAYFANQGINVIDFKSENGFIPAGYDAVDISKYSSRFNALLEIIN